MELGSPGGLEDVPIGWTMRETTHVDGGFEFGFVPDLPASVGHQVIRGAFVNLSHTAPVEPEPGKTVTVTVGGRGRTAKGRVDLDTNDYVKKVYRPDQVRMLAEEMAVAGIENDGFMATYVPEVEEDGSFRFVDIPPGMYKLTVDVHAPRQPMVCGGGLKLATGESIFTVADGPRDEDVTLEPVELKVFPRPVVGDVAPEIMSRTFDEKEFNLSDLKGKVVVLDFWATWCAPCRHEARRLKPLYEKYGADDGVRFLGVNFDHTLDAAKGFVGRE